jgi:IrrE N-terminal-like domain
LRGLIRAGGELDMPRKRRNSRYTDYIPKHAQLIETIALEWRETLHINGEHAPDISAILNRPNTQFPNINLRTFPSTNYRKNRALGWSNARTRSINIREDFVRAVQRAQPEARWLAAHELGHIALDHPGNNLFWASGYLAGDKILEGEAEAFAVELLAPFHLAKNLQTLQDYVTRFRIPYDKARSRKQQVDYLKRKLVRLAPGGTENTNTKDTKDVSHSLEEFISTQLALPPPTRKEDVLLLKPPEQLYLPFHTFYTPINQLVTAKTINDKKSRARISQLENLFHCPFKTSEPIVSYKTIVALEDRELVEALLRDVNKSIKKYRRWIKSGCSIAVFSIGVSPLLTEALNGAVKIFLLAISGAIVGVFAFFQVLDRPFGLDARIEKWARSKLEQESQKRGAARKLEKFDVIYKNGQFELKSASPSPEQA